MRTLSQGSVTNWFVALKEGDEIAAQKLWERFSRRLLGLARKKLEDTPRQAADEEDVALSAFDSFCRGAEKGHFPQLQDRDGLWQMLVVITIRKAIDLHHHEARQKRGGLQRAWTVEEAHHLTSLLSQDPGPELAAIVAETYTRMMGLLNDAELRTLAQLKMEGYTDNEIATRLQCTRRTVQRRLRLIRQIWEPEVG